MNTQYLRKRNERTISRAFGPSRIAQVSSEMEPQMPSSDDPLPVVMSPASNGDLDHHHTSEDPLCFGTACAPNFDGDVGEVADTLQEVPYSFEDSDSLLILSEDDSSQIIDSEEDSPQSIVIDNYKPQLLLFEDDNHRRVDYEDDIPSDDFPASPLDSEDDDYTRSIYDHEYRLRTSMYDDYALNNAASQIRLLKLEDGAGTPKWTMVSPVQLQRKPDKSSEAGQFFFDGAVVSFAAVSYEWGVSTQTETLDIDGTSFQVRKNLAHFIRAFSNQRRSGREPNLPGYLWIDSICINQENKEEKSHQIRLLNRVYRSAACVVSWLGDAPHTKAMGYLVDTKSDWDMDLDVRGLLNSTYWTRIWMVQEIVLAQKWYIMCSEQVLDAKQLTKHLQLEDQDSRAFKIVEERELFKRHGTSSLMNLLCRFLHLESTYPVDKIRALLALCSDDTDNLDRLLHPFAENTREYGLHPKDKNEICEEVVRLARESDLDCKPWALVACRDLVAGVLGVNMPYLAAQLGTVFAERKTDWYAKEVVSAPNPIIERMDRLEDKRQGKWEL